MTNLLNLDIFKLLKLESLSQEEKTKRLKEMEEIIFQSLVKEDLPLYLDGDGAKELEKLLNQQPLDVPAVEDWLREKIPDFDLLLGQKTLRFKKDLVVAHLALWQKARPEDSAITQALTAINQDNWPHAAELIEKIKI